MKEAAYWGCLEILKLLDGIIELDFQFLLDEATQKGRIEIMKWIMGKNNQVNSIVTDNDLIWYFYNNPDIEHSGLPRPLRGLAMTNFSYFVQLLDASFRWHDRFQQ